MFVFFSNRLGCMGSLLLSAGITLVLLLLFGVFDANGAEPRAERAKTTVTIKSWTPGPPTPEWRGRLSSEKPKCNRDRYIELFRRAGPNNVAQGNTTATRQGDKWVWELPAPLKLEEGTKYFATVTATADCLRAESKIYTYPDDNPPPR